MAQWFGQRAPRRATAGRAGKTTARTFRFGVETLEARRLLSVSAPTGGSPFSTLALGATDQDIAWQSQGDRTFKDELGRPIATVLAPQVGLPTYENRWFAQLKSGFDASTLATLPGIATITPIDPSAQTYELTFSAETYPALIQTNLARVEGLRSAFPLTTREYSLRLVPNDPLFGDQWSLLNTGQSGGTPGADANLSAVWDTYLGTGVVIGIVDDGLQHLHPDLQPQYLPSASFDFNYGDSDPLPGSNDEHGTAVAGVAAARGNNSLGISGAAPGAQLAGLRLLAQPANDLQQSNALSYALQTIDIYSNSWGPEDDAQRLDGPGPLAAAKLLDGVTNGRGGLGTIYVWAAGNGLVENDNVNYDGWANSRYTIAVSAIDHNGEQSSYSEPGAPILVAAYSNGAGAGITTTDLLGSPGYSTTEYTSTFGGTSAAAPLVSGVVALMLEANPNLTWRDVQHILVNSAAQNDSGDADWVLNGAGHLVNHKYGFGAIDAGAAVAAAETWTTVGTELSAHSGNISVGQSLPDNNPTGVTSTYVMTEDVTIEWVEVKFNATHPYRGDLRVELISPDGTSSILATPHDDSNDNYNNWIFTSARHWDESSLGTWTLKVSDQALQDVGTWNSWSLSVYGTAGTTSPYPRVVGATPSGTVLGSVEMVDLQFSVAMDQTSFALLDDVAAFTGPGGDLSAQLVGFTWLNATTLRISFQPQSDAGAYALTVGPQILALGDSSPMDQNLNETPGEAVDDKFVSLFTISPGDTAEIHGFKWNDLDGNGVWDELEPALPDWEIFLDLNSNGSWDTISSTVASGDVPQPIPNLSTIESTLDVSDILGEVVDVTVTLDISHSWDSDLDVYLVGPTEERVLLFSNVGGSNDNFTGTTFDDQAPTPITSGDAPFTGTFQPMESLAAFAGLDPTGTWRLEVTDAVANDSGTLNSWSLTLHYVEPHTTTDENGAYAFTELPEGSYLVAERLQPGWIQTYPLPPETSSVPPRVVPPISTTGSNAPTVLAGEFVPYDPDLYDPTRTNLSGPVIRLDDFRADPRFAGIDGTGLATVILDTGINLTHPFFGPDLDENDVADRIVHSWDYADNDSDASDVNGHGSNVASIVASQDAFLPGMAPGSDIIALKVFPDVGTEGNFSWVEDALQWIVANAETYNIASINMSFGDEENYAAAVSLYGIGDELAALAALDVVVVSAAGNAFFTFDSEPGVTYPAADPNSLAVGAVWDSNTGGSVNWSSGAKDFSTGVDRIVSFSQRHAALSDIFAPGAYLSGASAAGSGVSSMGGTSQASPHIAGIALLAQQLALQELGRRLTPAEFRTLLRDSAVSIVDGDDEDDNVDNTGLSFPRVDVFALGEAILAMNTSAAAGTHTVVLTAGQVVTDVNFGNLLLPPNELPVADAGGPYEIAEGEDLLLDASASFDPDSIEPLTLSWDLNGDDVFGDAVGATSTVTWAELVALQIDNGPNPWNVRVRATDVDEGVSTSPDTTLTVNNAPPTASLAGPQAVRRNATSLFTLLATDPSPVDEGVSFTFEIDWTGDGLVDQTVNGLSGVTASHAFPAAGSYAVGVRGIDQDGGASDWTVYPVHVFSVELIGNDLVWHGSDGADRVHFVQLSPTMVEIQTLLVGGHTVNFVDQATFSGQIQAFGHKGNDRLDASLLIDKPVYFEGGFHHDTLIGSAQADVLKGDHDGAAGDGAEGNDRIEGRGGNDSIFGDGAEGGFDTILGGDGDDVIRGDGGDGAEGRADSLLGGTGNDQIFGHTGNDFIDGGADNDLLVGGRDGSEGDDTIIGGSGNDILVGEKGNDRLEGTSGSNILLGGIGSDTLLAGTGADILVADETDYDQSAAGLSALRNEWASGGGYATRINNIRSGGGLTGGNTLDAGTSVVDDGAVDHLFGNNQIELNWYIYNLAFDQITDQHATETADDTDGT